MSSKTGLISIVVPTLNAASHLEVMFPSLQRQTYKNFEVIINDDKRTNDRTSEVINIFKDKFPIVYIHKNTSMAQGRKAGASQAKGEYLFHLDADMNLSPKVLESCVQKIKEGYDALIVPEVSFGEGYWSQVKVFEKSLYIGDSSVESLRFCKTAVYWAVGGHNVEMVLSEDKDFDLRVRSQGYKVGRITENIFHNEGRMTLKKDLIKKFFYGKTAAVFIKKHPRQSAVQANLVFRGAYFRNWKKLVRYPQLSLGMFFIKSLEMIAAGLGFITGKLPFIKVNPWK